MTTRILPFSSEAEAAVVAAGLIDSSTLDVSGDIVQPDHFFMGSYRILFEAELALHRASVRVDMVTLATWLRDHQRLQQLSDERGNYGVAFLTELLNAVPYVGHKDVKAYSDIVYQHWQRREAIVAAQRATCKCYDGGDISEILEECTEALHRLLVRTSSSNSTMVHIGEAYKRALKKMFDAVNRGTGVSGDSTGFKALDAHLGGLHDGELTIIAGRPSMGKTAIATQIAMYRALSEGDGVLMFSLEMPNEQVALRTGFSMAAVDMKKTRIGNFEREDYANLLDVGKSLIRSTFTIDEQSMMTVETIRCRARAEKRKLERDGKKLRLIVIDYLQLMSGRDGAKSSREQEISEISRGLKGLAKELQMPVVALSQLNRGVETRSNKRPMLSDLRESGAIEQDADNIWLLYRDDYYNSDSRSKGLIEVDIGKQRNGGTGKVILRFDKEFVRFRDVDDEELRAAGIDPLGSY